MSATPQPDRDKTVVLSRLHDADVAVFEAVAGAHVPLGDAVLPALSEAASYSRLWMGVALGLTLFGGSRGRRAAVGGLIAIGVTSATANILMKGATRRSRPSSPVPESRRLDHPDSTSFPSGHTASAAAFSGVVAEQIPRLDLPINAVAGAVGFSRVYTGVHYPGDVLAGWILGKGVASIVNRAMRRFRAG